MGAIPIVGSVSFPRTWFLIFYEEEAEGGEGRNKKLKKKTFHHAKEGAIDGALWMSLMILTSCLDGEGKKNAPITNRPVSFLLSLFPPFFLLSSFPVSSPHGLPFFREKPSWWWWWSTSPSRGGKTRVRVDGNQCNASKALHHTIDSNAESRGGGGSRGGKSAAGRGCKGAGTVGPPPPPPLPEEGGGRHCPIDVRR